MYKYRLLIEAGIAIRGQVKREILTEAARMGIDVKTEEVKSLFESRYIFTLSGDEGKVKSFVRSVNRWVNEND